MAAPPGGGGGEGAGGAGSALTSSSLPPPRPKSPPEYPDLYGKRREAARVQMLEREIGFLEASVQPASRCCKEVSDFVLANSDPLIPAQRKSRRSCRFWKWLCSGIPCVSLASFCCCCQSDAATAAALAPNAVTGLAAQIAVVAQDRAARAVRAAQAVHASEVAVVLVRTYLAAFPPVSAVALDHLVCVRRRAHAAAATARSDGHLVLNVPRYDFVVVFAIVKICALILVV
ncbi:unnamed protein product [Thlaspi arvense]|uniref:G protein gamma domain-containing protein n=1 Tax=Thlaspi arvense TaxID=13288 RepID=A0AAU9SX48_THLAR|nr:unnamed protein product [Thlaspi arvense]